MALGPVQLVLDLSLAPLRLGARVVGGLLGLRGDDARSPYGMEETGESAARARPRAAPDPQRESKPKPWLDDTALARKVETTIFRDRSVPKGKIDVNAADGVVWLRGEVKTPEMINRLERQASRIPEVARVENLLHLPKTPAPTRTDTPASQRRTRRSRTSPAKRKVAGRVTAEKRIKGAEPSPADAASRRAGRKAAPLGAKGGRRTESKPKASGSSRARSPRGGGAARAG